MISSERMGPAVVSEVRSLSLGRLRFKKRTTSMYCSRVFRIVTSGKRRIAHASTGRRTMPCDNHCHIVTRWQSLTLPAACSSCVAVAGRLCFRIRTRLRVVLLL